MSRSRTTRAAGWTPQDLDVIGSADEVQVAPARRDGSHRPYTTIWIVRVGDDLYVRSYRGSAGVWYVQAVQCRRGRIRAGGVEREVAFAEAGDVDPSAVDGAYRRKYGRSTYVEAMVTPPAVATTMRLAPADREVTDV